MSVKNSYNEIAKHFSQTRRYSWPEFEIFFDLLDLQSSKSKESGLRQILDLGCWNWRLLSFLKNKDFSFSYTGLDQSEKMLEEAKKIHPEANFQLWKIQKLPFLDSTFDAVFLIASFHHLQTKKEREEALSEIKRILKPGWKVFLTNWNLFQKKYFKTFFLNFFQKKVWNDCFVPFSAEWKFKTLRFYHAFLPNELRNLFQKNWFEIEKEFFIKKWELQKNPLKSHNFCHVLKVKS